MRRADPVVIGGGPAGAAAALHLLRAGAKPIVLERSARPADALCGGFLSWRTLAQLQALDIELEGAPITHVALIDGRRERAFALPAPAIALSRAALDSRLLDAAIAAGADVRRGLAVQQIDGLRLRLSDGTDMAPETLFLATGKHGLRGVERREAAGETMVGLRVRMPPLAARSALIDGRIELHLFRGGYAGLLLQEDGSANLCMAIAKQRLSQAGGDPARLIGEIIDASPALTDRMGDWHPGRAIDAIGHVPYGWRANESPAGLFRLGDQAAVIPSLAGEGIGLALASADMAVSAWATGGPEAAPRYQRRFAATARRPLAVAGLVAWLAEKGLLPDLAHLPGAFRLAAGATRVRPY